MRRQTVQCLLLMGIYAMAAPAHAQRRVNATRPTIVQPSPMGPATPPHAWLFGTWTGGIFPVLDGMVAQDCRTQPTVIFAQDAVAHASLLGTGMSQRVIETVRTSPAGAEMRFSPDTSDAGFGCENAETLHVARENDIRISFPHCAAFPYPLQRCAPAGR